MVKACSAAFIPALIASLAQCSHDLLPYREASPFEIQLCTQETRQAQRRVRAAKAKESALRQTGVRPSIARKEALSAGRGGTKLKSKQKKHKPER